MMLFSFLHTELVAITIGRSCVELGFPVVQSDVFVQNQANQVLLSLSRGGGVHWRSAC